MSSERDNPRSFWLDFILLVLAAAIFVALIGLGTWQVKRLGWKLDLIEAVNGRAFGEPVDLPSGAFNADMHAYLRVKVSGTLLYQASARVKAVTASGLGSWIMTPLRTRHGIVWINRGFVPDGIRETEIQTPPGSHTVTGLLRASEPGGTLLERNDPGADRWYSRDVEALSASKGYAATTPSYFIDADHASGPRAWPRGGMTNVQFRNNHLSYALTWFGMAALLLFGVAYVVRLRLLGDRISDGRWQNSPRSASQTR
ncbi:MAG: SURF1 family protein [Pseudomonadota bacterium]